MQKKNNNLVWLAIVLLVWFVVNNLRQPQTGVDAHSKITYSELYEMAEKGELEGVVMITVSGGYKVRADGYVVEAGDKKLKTYETFVPTSDSGKLLESLREKGIKYDVQPESRPSMVESILIGLLGWLPMIILFLLLMYMMRGVAGGGGTVMKFGQSRAKLLNEDTNAVTFEDVAGVEEAKEELKEIIEFLKDPIKFTKLGGKIPKGCLLVGPPGTGKTLLARAVAGEAKVPFFTIAGSDFVEMFVGVGASRVRDLFSEGKKRAPCIIFIDELDAVGRHRGAGLGGGHDEREQTLNQLLVEMDGFSANEGVIIVAATNRPDVLDPALLRPGRFGRRVVVPRPDIRGREAILKVHTRKVPLAKNVSLFVLARGTPGFAGADLENLVNEAVLIAARNNKEAIGMEELELAKDKVIMGAERKTMVLTSEEKEIISYHESGHALVAKLIKKDVDPVHKVTIIPRGMALGLTQQLPVDEKHIHSKEYLFNMLAVLFGGRSAEELIFGRMTTGASNDIEKATDIARKMVCEWGMSERMGPMTFGKKGQEIFLGRDFTQTQDYSENTAMEIDAEVKRIVIENYNRTKKLLEDNLEFLHKIAKKLLEKETLDGAELDALINGEQDTKNPPSA